MNDWQTKQQSAPLIETPVSRLRGVGPRIADRLGKLDIKTLWDLLLHLPSRYQDRTRITPIGALQVGQHAVIEGTIELSEVAIRRRRMLLVRINDGTGGLTLRFFTFSAAQQQRFGRGVRLRCFGEIRRGAVSLEMVHPESQIVDNNEVTAVEEALTPVYPATEGLSQLKLRNLTGLALEQWQRNPGRLGDPLPNTLRDELRLPDLQFAIQHTHSPSPETSIDQLESFRSPAQRRLAFDELLAQQISLKLLRKRVQQQKSAPLPESQRLVPGLLAALPFKLTGAQQRVVSETARDLTGSAPTMRLVQGDVGSGKTVVAALAALQAIEADKQAVMMAPTELLAEQHRNTLASWLEPLGLSVAWLSGQLKGKAREAAREAARSADLIVGTHALFQHGVDFERLALVIIDEQHRFGVHQRLALKEKGAADGLVPHQLIMTATPIPRTLAMTAYADLDCSVIDELPPGRTPITTVAVNQNRREEVIERVSAACVNGQQCYWVCTLVEESELLEAEAAEATAQRLADDLPTLRIGLVHGRMRATDKESVMQRFKDHELDLLVATTVIEVGVDVPNASLMMIENAERLGLSQLHQLRGRVGRGSRQSHCVLLYKEPLSAHATSRLAAMRETTDGFEIARRDLELRGPGEFLGTRQTGLVHYRIADLSRDADLLEQVHRVADNLLSRHPESAKRLQTLWIAENAAYGAVG